MERQIVDRDVSQFLLTAGFLPPFPSPLTDVLDRDLSPDLYREWLSGRPRNRLRAEMLEWLERGLANGSVLECRASSWNTNEFNLLWWPYGLPVRPLVGLLSSRPPVRHSGRFDWVGRLMAILESLHGTSDMPCSVATTVCDGWVKQWAMLQGVALTVGQVGRDSDLRKWRRAILKQPTYAAREDWRLVFISPAQLTKCADDAVPSAGICEPPIPGADSWLAQLCGRLVGVYVRPGGNVDRLVQRIRSQSGLVAKPVDVCSDGDLSDISRSCRFAKPVREESVVSPLPYRTEPAARILDSHSFLVHTTRGQCGESEAAMRDAILRRPEFDRTAVGTLVRILHEGKIAGSNLAIRGGYRVVCLTSRSLRELMDMRAYRPHRMRWDFEPYGIAVRRETLVAMGARPVLYGENQDWQQLEEHDRPFFQCRGNGRGKYDWTREWEWRVVGDLDLGRLSGNDVLAFVRRDVEARNLTQEFDWRVVSLESERVFFRG